MAKPPQKLEEFPDPKDWKLCEIPFCQTRAIEQITYENIIDEEEKKKAWRDLARYYAIYLEDSCWKHLSLKQQRNYSARLSDAVLNGASLEGANLWGIEIRLANLNNVKARGACFMNANLQMLNAYRADFREAAFFGANLQGAILTDADLRSSDLHNAMLHDAFLRGVILDGAKDLSWEQIKRVGEEKKKNWSGAQDAYRRLKNYFHQQGKYSDEGQAYYREKLMAQCVAWQYSKLGKWFWFFLLNILAGYGEKIERTILSAFGTILFFSGLYWWGTNAGWGKIIHDTAGHIKDFWHCLYFSVVTFATLGFGDIAPAFQSGAAIVAVIEVILGYVFLGMLITIIARRFGR